MSSLPTAHASQRFGRRQIEFFAVSGHVAGTDGRTRALERRIQDLDGGNHAIRLADRNARLEPGDSVAILRLQAGPERGSRPVSAINYAQNSWTELGKGASASLARTGISRGGLWWFAMLAFMATALAIVWSDLRIFLIEVNSGIFGATPDFALLPWLDAQMPFLRDFDLAARMPGLPDAIAATGLFAAEQANLVVTSVLLIVLGLIAYGARTWRIVWVPVFILAVLAASLMLAGDAAADFALLSLGVAGLFFALAGLINRIRDAARLRGRIARLSEHLLRHPPVESVTTPAPPRAAPAMASPGAQAASGTASAAAMAAVAAAVSNAGNRSGEATAEDSADAPAETGADAGDDDLPSDAELEAARASLDGESPELAALSNRSPAPAVSLDLDEPSDRDMILPPPPPMAGSADEALAGDSGADETRVEAEPTPVVAPDDADAMTTQLRADPQGAAASGTVTAVPQADTQAVPETEPEARAETVQASANPDGRDDDDTAGDSDDSADFSGPDPMMSSGTDDADDARDAADSRDAADAPDEAGTPRDR